MSGANQEHGIVSREGSVDSTIATRFPVGTLLRILPNHACATGAQFPKYYALGDDPQIDVWERFMAGSRHPVRHAFSGSRNHVRQTEMSFCCTRTRAFASSIIRPKGTSEKVAAIRGTLPGQGAKACSVRSRRCLMFSFWRCCRATRKVDFKKLGQAVGGKKASLVSPELAVKLTGCVMGAVPPFSFWPNVKLVVDPKLLDEHEEVAFNAGRLDTSMVLNAEDYRRIAAPLMAIITAD